MEFFTTSTDTLKVLVIALGTGIGVWGVINLMERYGNDNPGAKASGQERLWVRNGSSTTNLNTLAHISALAVAFAAVLSGLRHAFRSKKHLRRTG